MRVRYTPRARSDLSEIAEYLRPRSPAGAKRVGAALDAFFKTLSRYPYSGRLQDVPHVRKGVVPPWGYLVYYRVDDDAVVVLAVQHPAQARPFADD